MRTIKCDICESYQDGMGDEIIIGMYESTVCEICLQKFKDLVKQLETKK